MASVCFSRKRSPEAEGFMVGGFADSCVRRFTARACGGEGTEFVGHRGPVYSADVDGGDQFVMSASHDKTCRLWRATGGKAIAEYRGHSGPVWSVAFSPIAYYFATGSHDRTARLWTTDRIRPVRIFAGHFEDVDVVKWHPNGTLMASGSGDRTVRLWDIHAATHARFFIGHTAPISALALSPSGRLIAVGTDSGSVVVWDIAEARRLSVLNEGNTTDGRVTSLTFSPDSNVLMGATHATGSPIRCWDLQKSSGSELVKTFAVKASHVLQIEYFASSLVLGAGVCAAVTPSD